MYYFAYGSNLNKARMRECCPENKPRFTAVLPNYKLCFTGWSRKWRGGTATIKHMNGEKVVGAVYELSDKDLRRLDKCEACPSVHTRLNVLVFRDNDDPVEAVTYLKNDNEETGPSADYIAVMKQGLKDWGILL